MDNVNPALSAMAEKFTGVVTALATQTEPSSEDVLTAIGGVTEIAMLAINAVLRIADALEKIADCSDGVHPSAFRVIKQG